MLKSKERREERERVSCGEEKKTLAFRAKFEHQFRHLPRSSSRARFDLVQELLCAGGAWRQRGRHDGGRAAARGRWLVVVALCFGVASSIVVVAA